MSGAQRPPDAVRLYSPMPPGKEAATTAAIFLSFSSPFEVSCLSSGNSQVALASLCEGPE